MIDKQSLFAAHADALRAQLEALDAGARSAQEGMRVDGDHRPASRGERGAVSGQAALRAGLLVRGEELRRALQELEALSSEPRDRVAVGAVVRVDDGVEGRWVAILPGGQGATVEAGAPVAVVSPASPLARALLGLEPGDAAELSRPGGLQELEVEEVL